MDLTEAKSMQVCNKRILKSYVPGFRRGKTHYELHDGYEFRKTVTVVDNDGVPSGVYNIPESVITRALELFTNNGRFSTEASYHTFMAYLSNNGV